MKKLVNLLGFISAFVTSIIIICTFLTTYQFHFVNQIFNSYLPIQLGVCITMAILGLRFIIIETGKKRLVYAAFSLAISAFLIFFMVNHLIK
ncbi:hypothetical protein [Clostridium saccharoperbutylacetonicum]|uniref:Uncharacterized protein n=1 Tax=Clostridium saccharoperbutylacetonicum N1-4(HMT) TaxID=931276 RepID=M1MD29_9CLOT|nr:hypothetical protein [Clostridium saccharoperbutylacetonicum]AGF54283.1 hypothetical protein Cspa_c04650 [Clostridium saccharoperbutylacetonicum N1-4(HMT)]AQR93199.1 hypothetical protein CLSAP_04760 [Clostridium saccharoperbutylacetonicum]NRT59201.1 hypothetical protein [Clostridium saccharoperbutylacetonicum]NSB28390.1 hypothetical protein [Clostridium saccharoperbutylacetonicum]NSB34616.1 hypothetical protein [Clostridium saccharoperbutylacetonicum]